MSDDAVERLAVLETKVTHLEASFEEIKTAINELRPLVWKASGSIITVLVLAEIFLKGAK